VSIDCTASVHVPLYTGVSKHDVIVGHPVTLTLTQSSGSSSGSSDATAVQPCGALVQVSHVDSVPGVSDTWHVSVQNPTKHALTVTLHTAMGLPFFQLGGGPSLRLGPSETVLGTRKINTYFRKYYCKPLLVRKTYHAPRIVSPPNADFLMIPRSRDNTANVPHTPPTQLL
jgi:hypothetical protein